MKKKTIEDQLLAFYELLYPDHVKAGDVMHEYAVKESRRGRNLQEIEAIYNQTMLKLVRRYCAMKGMTR